MILPTLANVEWPSAMVASALVICPTIFFTVVAARHTIHDVEKLAGYFASAFGVLLGVFITYFFTEKTTQAKVETVQAQSAAELGLAQTELAAYRAASDALKTKSPEIAKWFEEMIVTPTSYRKPKSPTPSPSPSE